MKIATYYNNAKSAYSFVFDDGCYRDSTLDAYENLKEVYEKTGVKIKITSAQTVGFLHEWIIKMWKDLISEGYFDICGHSIDHCLCYNGETDPEKLHKDARETKEKLDTELKVAEEFYGKNSVEWLKAKNNIDSFLAKTTVSKTLPIETVNEDLKKIKIDYRTQLAYLDYNMLHAENGKYAEVFSKYKQETTKLYTILNSVSNNMTNAEQDKEINIIYDNISEFSLLFKIILSIFNHRILL